MKYLIIIALISGYTLFAMDNSRNPIYEGFKKELKRSLINDLYTFDTIIKIESNLKLIKTSPSFTKNLRDLNNYQIEIIQKKLKEIQKNYNKESNFFKNHVKSTGFTIVSGIFLLALGGKMAFDCTAGDREYPVYSDILDSCPSSNSIISGFFGLSLVSTALSSLYSLDLYDSNQQRLHTIIEQKNVMQKEIDKRKQIEELLRPVGIIK